MLLCGDQTDTCCKQPLVWGDHLPHCPKTIPHDFNPKSEFDSPWKSINDYSKSNVTSSSINMLLALVQKSWEKNIQNIETKNISNNKFTRAKFALPTTDFCALRNYLQIFLFLFYHTTWKNFYNTTTSWKIEHINFPPMVFLDL